MRPTGLGWLAHVPAHQCCPTHYTFSCMVDFPDMHNSSHLSKQLSHAANRIRLVGLYAGAPCVASHARAAAKAEGQHPTPPFPAHAQTRINRCLKQCSQCAGPLVLPTMHVLQRRQKDNT